MESLKLKNISEIKNLMDGLLADWTQQNRISKSEERSKKNALKENKLKKLSTEKEKMERHNRALKACRTLHKYSICVTES